MKAKVIKVDYRKESESFPDWMKYEITLLNEDGSEELIPAYGKDLQHALSRVVKSRKADRIKSKTNKIPQEVWILLTFLYVTMVSIPANLTKNPMWVILGLAGMAALLFGFKLYLTNKK
jgi:hypothetical protein